MNAVKEKLQQARIKWGENPDKQRLYFFIACFLLLAIILSPFLFGDERGPPRTIIGLIGASVIFLFHEYMRLRFLETEDCIPFIKERENLTTIWIGTMDLLIAAPMIGFDTSSQMYTAQLVRIVMLSIFLWAGSKVYLKTAEYVKMSDGEMKEYEENVGDPFIIKYMPWEYPDPVLDCMRSFRAKSAQLQTHVMALPLYLIAIFYILFMVEQMIATVLFFLLGNYPIGLKGMIAFLSIVCPIIILYPWVKNRFDK